MLPPLEPINNAELLSQAQGGGVGAVFSQDNILSAFEGIYYNLPRINDWRIAASCESRDLKLSLEIPLFHRRLLFARGLFNINFLG